MNEDRKTSELNWRAVIGWLVFLLVLLAGPLSSFARRMFGGSFPSNLWGYLPLIIGGLVILSFAISAVRAFGQSRTGGAPRPPSSPLPPVSGPQLPPAWTAPTSQQPPLPPGAPGPQLPPASPTTPARQQSPLSPPQFDPLISPKILLLGILGLLILGGVGLFIYLQNAP
jgi:hypothetical protein